MNRNPRTSQRRYYGASERSQLIQSFRDSGLTRVEFAEQRGVKLATLHQWLSRERRRSPSSVITRDFLEVKVVPARPSTGWMAELSLASGHTLRLAGEVSPGWVRSLVANLQGLC